MSDIGAVTAPPRHRGEIEQISHEAACFIRHEFSCVVSFDLHLFVRPLSLSARASVSGTVSKRSNFSVSADDREHVLDCWAGGAGATLSLRYDTIAVGVAAAVAATVTCSLPQMS